MSTSAICAPVAKAIPRKDPLKWRPHDEYARVTNCGHYTVAKYGQSEPFQYQAWALAGGVWFRQLGPLVDDYETARGLCEAHHQEAP